MAAANEISITRALTELKTLDKRIQKLIDSSTFISYEGQFNKPSEYVKTAGANYQAINDLLKRRRKIKAAIVSSNANTVVTIGGEKMSIAEAIETKSSIKHYKALMEKLKSQYAQVNREVENINDRTRRDLDNKLNSMSKDKDGGGLANMNEFSEKYISMHGVKLADPIRITEKIAKLEDFVREFEDEVNYVLTEKNSTTAIAV